MKRKAPLILSIAAVAVISISLATSFVIKNNLSNQNYVEEHTEENDDFYVDELANTEYTPSFTNKSPLFVKTTNLDSLTYNENAPSINKDYDKFPVLNNSNEFQALKTFDYGEINGENVKAYSFYRYKNEAANNPNVACGLLLYHTIRYKLAYPEEENIYIGFSSYRISVTAAVCVLPESRYYGYMRALYNQDYDEFGFVTIGYMLVEAARLGIHVTIVGQLNSYSVKQYKDDGETLYKKAEPSYKTYFNNALKTSCYDDFAPGKKVSDYMNFQPVAWTLSDKGGTDMMHLKTCISSHYLDEAGNPHRYGSWFTCSNLDTIDYRGSEGGNWAQSGVLVADHYYIFQCTKNYLELMAKYSNQGGIYEMRNIVYERNTKQMQMYLNGEYDKVPENELLLYQGTESDHVFEAYFTPLGGYNTIWDEVNNPVCRYTSQLVNSKEGGTFVVLNPRTDLTFSLYLQLKSMLNKKFVVNKNLDNRLCIDANSFDTSEFSGLKAKRDLAAISLKYSKGALHCKDYLFSYVDKEGTRQYITLLNSCNLHGGAYFYQTNSFITIHENENMESLFFNNFGAKCSHGVIVDK